MIIRRKQSDHLFFSILLLQLISQLCHSTKDTFSRISDSFISIQCVPHAYGDFNADKRVDIFCVNKSGNQVEIWLAQDKEPLFSQFQVLDLNSQVVNIVPGDFTGDSVMDVLVTYKSNESNNYKMSFFQGKKTSKDNNSLDTEKKISFEIVDQPFVSDFNGDGRLDLLLTVIDNTVETKFYYFDINGTIQPLDSLFLDPNVKLKSGYAHSVTDVNNDFKPDLILTGHENNIIHFYVLVNNQENNQYELFTNYTVPDDTLVYGQSLFADFDSDGNIEHLLPSCSDNECSKSKIFIYKNGIWNLVPIDFSQYGFIAPKSSVESWGNSISVKAGDYNLNGYLDLMLVLEDKVQTKKEVDTYAILMRNIPNNIHNASSTFNRTFEIDQPKISLFSYTNVAQASFFDLYDDGYLDILLVLKENDNYHLVGLKNDYYDDVYFLKVMVIPGLCNAARCPFQSLPYGLNYPGALIKIETISNEFQRVVMYATQLSQSGYMALQLPYTVFGLGSTPNFVEHLSVGILSEKDKLKSVSKEWHQIIPNSQLVISPYPRYNTNNWKMQLFITPSKNIIMTAIALGSTMVCLIIMIGLLQFREKKMDEKERKIESQRFHFDGL